MGWDEGRQDQEDKQLEMWGVRKGSDQVKMEEKDRTGRTLTQPTPEVD